MFGLDISRHGKTPDDLVEEARLKVADAREALAIAEHALAREVKWRDAWTSTEPLKAGNSNE